VPPRRRIDADGHPTVGDLEESIRTHQSSSIGLLAVERKAEGDVIGYCGLIESDRGEEPELAFELLRRDRDTRPRPRSRFWTGRDRPGTCGCLPRSGTGTSLLAGYWPSSGSPRQVRRTSTRSTGPPSSPHDRSDSFDVLPGRLQRATCWPFRVTAGRIGPGCRISGLWIDIRVTTNRPSPGVTKKR
jgi:hypothetical protein